MKTLQKVLSSFRKLLTVDLTAGEATSVIMQTLFLPVDWLCGGLARRFDYFKPIVVSHSIYDEGFLPETSDERGNFIPVRLAVFLDEAIRTAIAGDEASAEKWNDFRKMAVARFQYDAIEESSALRDAFSPFDPDSDALYDVAHTAAELVEKREKFFELVDSVLTSSNYVELPREVVDRALAMKRPGALPVQSDYAEFHEYRVYARGIKKTPIESFPRWKTLGRDVRIQSEILSRVCVVARLKDSTASETPNGAKETREAIDSLRNLADSKENATPRETGTSATRKPKERITIKIFKDVALENMNMIAPRVRLKFPLFDGFKIAGTFGAGAATAIMKIVLAAAFNLMVFIVFAFAFLLSFVKSALGFVHRRTAYLQKYVNRLYYHSLASNQSAIDAIIYAAEEQEVKEFVLGYIMALKRGDWSTEREIDDDAEAWMLDRFGVDVDFESADALRKLREKNLLETRTDAGTDGATVERYRVKSLDDALAQMDNEWDSFFDY